jgi:hypothetical protein
MVRLILISAPSKICTLCAELKIAFILDLQAKCLIMNDMKEYSNLGCL